MHISLHAARTMRHGTLLMLLAAAPAALPEALPAQEAPPAPITVRVVGRVLDSLGARPLPGAAVRLFRPADPTDGRSTVTDSSGAFALDSVPGGLWVAAFAHPVLDALRAESPLVRLDLTESGTVAVELATPSPRAVLAATCGPRLGDEDGAVVGDVRDAVTNAPMGLATVVVEWPEWLFAKKSMAREAMRRVARTDANGRYVLCGAPKASTVTAQAWRGADSTGLIEVEIPADGYRVQDFAVGTGFAVSVDSAANAAPGSELRAPRAGRAGVRGRVTTAAGTPLAGVMVRVLGSGTMVRTGEAGTFTIPDAVAGTQTVEARAIGYEPSRQSLRLSDGASLELAIALPKRRVALDTVRVVAGRPLPPEVVAIERRWTRGVGTFMDGTMVRERTSTYLSDALVGIAGVEVRMNSQGFGQHVLMRDFRGNRCRATVFVDGVPLDIGGVATMTLDEYVSRDEVAAIEVYPRPLNLPPEYLSTRDCGVVAAWTRMGLGRIPVFDPRKRPKRG
jgi:hypothetical protein